MRLALSALFLPACARVVQINDMWVAQRVWQEDQAQVRVLAADHLSCPPDQIELILLENVEGYWPSTIGAQGCDDRAAYVRRNGRWIRDVGAGAPAEE